MNIVESSHWKPGEWPKNVKDHQKIKNPASVQKLKGNLSRWNLRMHLASRHEKRKRYIAATHRAILSNALVAASSCKITHGTCGHF